MPAFQRTDHSFTRIILGLPVWLAGLTSVACGQQPPLNLEVIGLSIQSSFAGQADQPRTEVTFRVRSEQGIIIAVDEVDAAPLILFDQQGTELGREDWVHSQSWDEGKSSEFSIDVTRTPPRGTTQLRVRGQVRVRVGHDLQTQRVEVKFAAGEKLRLADLDLELETITTGDSPSSFLEGFAQLIQPGAAVPNVSPDGTVDYEVGFKTISPRGFGPIHSWAFVNSDKSVLESGSISSSSGPDDLLGDSPVVFRRGFRVEKLTPTGALEVNYFKRIDEINLPVDVVVGLGL